MIRYGLFKENLLAMKKSSFPLVRFEGVNSISPCALTLTQPNPLTLYYDKYLFIIGRWLVHARVVLGSNQRWPLECLHRYEDLHPRLGFQI